MLRLSGVFTVLVLLLLAACGSGIDNDPILRLAADEALAEGRRLMLEKKYRQAKNHLIHAFEVEPNSVSGRDGLLEAADALFAAGGVDALVEAETRYRDFINRFPTSDKAGYAQFRIGMCLAARMEKPNRDQETSRKALGAFEDLLRAYPTSEHSQLAHEEIERVRNHMAEAEFRIGFFYLRTSGTRRTVRLAHAAIRRFEHILAEYPSFPKRELLLFYLCRSHYRVGQPEKAGGYREQLADEYPQSTWLKKVSKEEKASSSSLPEEAEVDLKEIAKSSKVPKRDGE